MNNGKKIMSVSPDACEAGKGCSNRDKFAGIALTTSLIYAALAALWILFFDKLLPAFISNPKTIAGLSTCKSLGFVTITAWLLYLAVRRQLKLQARETSGRKDAEDCLQKTNRALGLTSRCNQILIRATDEAELLNNICRLIVEEGGYALAWVGYAQENEAKSVRSMARAGLNLDYLDGLHLTWADAPRGRGPVGSTLRTGRVSLVRNLEHDAGFAPWREQALRCGYQSVISLPLTSSDKTFGALCIYSTGADVFDIAETDLLLELAGDLAFGIAALHSQAAHRRIEQALRGSEERLRLAQAAAKIGIFDVDLVRHHATWTDEEETIFGFAPGTYDHTSDTFWQLLHPGDRENIRHMVKQAIADQSEFGAEFRFHRQNDQSPRWALMRGKAVYDENRQPLRLLGVNIDITEHKNAEQALRMSEALYHSLVDQMPAGVFLKNTEGRYVFVNSLFCRLQDMGAEDFLGKLPGEIAAGAVARHNPEGLAVKHAVKGGQNHAWIMQHGKSIREDEEYTGGNGQKLFMHLVSIPVRGADGKIVGTQGMMFDVTQGRVAEEGYRRLATAVEQAAEGIMITDATGKILYVNPAFEKTTGYSRTEVAGQNPRLLKSDRQDAAFYQRMWAVLSVGRVWSGRLINKKKDGSLFEVEATISPIRNAAGKITNHVAVKRDVTREVALEAQLRQSQKMEAIGQLAGGIAHDFNNLLTAIHANAAQLLEAPLSPGETSECSQQILEAAERAASLTRQLLMFSRKQIIQPVNLDLNEVVAQTARMLQRILGEDISLVSDAAGNLPFIQADAGMMEQILLNLAVNSRDAMPNGGKLVIATGAEILDDKQTARHPGAQPGHYVHLSITDSGCGIAPEHLPRIFEPFFTTKEAGKGTGLGLATVYGIVRQHHGWITVSSEPGQGTTFRIYFPAVLGKKAGKPAPSGNSKLPRGTELILLVEDELTVRLPVSNMLQRFGYSVLATESGVEALKIWQLHRDRIHLLLTDIVMPDGMTGYELARRLKADKPELKVIFTSGYSADLGGRHSVLVEGVNFLQKPYASQELAEILRNSLKSGPEPVQRRFNFPKISGALSKT
jgi:PAS domain S-box-containing protein